MSDDDAVQEVLEALRAARGSMTRVRIEKAVGKRALVVKRAIRELVNAGSIVRLGEGVRGDPFRYVVPAGPGESEVPEDDDLETEQPETRPESGLAGNCDSCDEPLIVGAAFCHACGFSTGDDDDDELADLRARVEKQDQELARLRANADLVGDLSPADLGENDDDDDDEENHDDGEEESGWLFPGW